MTLISHVISRDESDLEKIRTTLRLLPSVPSPVAPSTESPRRFSKSHPRNSHAADIIRSTPSRSKGFRSDVSDVKSLPSAVRLNLSYGAKFNSMSIIRRYFLSFVLLDLSLHFLIYIFYLKHAHNFALMDLIGCQMKCYDIQTSFVDIMMVAVARFLILVTTYGLGESNSWFCSGLTTAFSNVFVIVKPFQYDWESECQKLMAASLILLTFVLPWLESFLVGFHLIELENLAQKFIEARPEVLRRYFPKIGFFKSLLPITRDLFRNLVVISNPYNLFTMSHDR